MASAPVEGECAAESSPSTSLSPPTKSPGDFTVASSPASSTHELTSSPQPLAPTGPEDIQESSPSSIASPSPNSRPSESPASQKSIFKSTPAGASRESIVSSSQLLSPLSVTSPSKLPDTGPRSALFDDHVASSHVPGSLHLAPDSTIQRLVDKQGYIPLIRQLAEDLAHRDRELVNFRRRAEERERALRKMLVEVEVSNADIEKRLVASTLQRKPSRDTMKSDADGMSYTESIDEMMQQVLSEEDSFSVADDASALNVSFEDDHVTPKATLRVPGLGKMDRDVDTISLNSNASRKSSTLRGWKGFFLGQSSSGPADEDTIKARRASAAGSTVKKRTSISPKTFNQPSGETEATKSLLRCSSRASLVSTRSTSGGQDRTPPPASIYTQHHFAVDQSQSKPPLYKSTSGTETGVEGAAHRRTSNSVAHWALRVVSQASPNDEYENSFSGIPPTSPSRPRSHSTPDGTLNGRKRGSSLSTGDNLQRSKARNAGAEPGIRIPTTSAHPPTKTTTFFQDIRDTAERIVPLGNSSQNAGTKKPDDAGPVEMDMIIPPEAQPPTLLQGWNQQYPNNFLTDRFGFIYNKQHRSVSIKGANSIEGSYTERKPSEEIFKTSTTVVTEDLTGTSPKSVADFCDVSGWSETIYGPTSLANVSLPPSTTQLSKVPSDGSKPTVSATSLVGRLSRPGASVSSPTTATHALSDATSAVRSQIASGASSAEESTVRLLLGQMSDLHDSLQRDRSVKWNEFLRKVRVERRRTEEDEKGMPETLMADGEVIGIATLGTEGRGGKQRWKEFKTLVLGGIPVTYRWKIWTECSGATSMKVPGYYDDLLQNGHDDPIVISQISMDINRTLTDNIFFRKGPGVSKLKQVLVAYSRRNTEVGYCQGMNMIAASLLLIMPSEEDAFWVLCSIVERILPKTYFEPNLLASRADQEVLKYYVSAILPSLHTHLMDLGVTLEALCFQWFLSIFTDTLAAEALFRVWDVVLCVAGSVFLFQVAIALLKLNEKALLRCDSAAEVYGYLNGGMIHQGISIDGLIRESDSLKNFIKKAEVEKRREWAVKKELGDAGDEERESEGMKRTDSVSSDGKQKSVDVNTAASSSQEPLTTEDVCTPTAATPAIEEEEERGDSPPRDAAE
ncbi:TBC-domain-containing protein [Wilcoxina mikolae CBS 423.85]|nr:TBC-domain-containing protein [Wilcoxina mikolae CBS 423.85]